MNLEPTPPPETPSLFDIEALEELAVEELAVGVPASPPAEESPEPALDLPVLRAFGGFELAQPANDTTERVEPEPPSIAAAPMAGPGVVIRAAPASRVRSGLILLVVVVSMAMLLAAIVWVIVTLIVLAVQTALG
jgi:hypothetical protein